MDNILRRKGGGSGKSGSSYSPHNKGAGSSTYSSQSWKRAQNERWKDSRATKVKFESDRCSGGSRGQASSAGGRQGGKGDKPKGEGRPTFSESGYFPLASQQV